MLEQEFQHLISKWRLIPEKLLHPVIIKRAYRLFLAGEFESAVIEAFKAVEIEVRRIAQLNLDDIGIKLIRKAFDPNQGPLTDMNLPPAEREAIAHLFSGALGLYKNPCSHRKVDMTYNEAFEKLNLASHLLKLLDSANERLSNP